MSEVAKQLIDFKDAVDANFCIRLADIWNGVNPKSWEHWTETDMNKFCGIINKELKKRNLII